MLKNYITIAWRNIIRTKGTSLINISGLAIGMAVAILIGLWVFDELNFNRSFKNHDRIAQVYHRLAFGTEILTVGDVPAPIGEALKSNFPELEDLAITSWSKEHIFTYNNTQFSKTGLFVEPQFARMFSITMLQGTDKSLKDAHSLIISETLAASVFGGNAMGKMLQFDNKELLTVTGVYEDFPTNSHFAEVQMLLPMAHYASISESNRQQLTSWEAYAFQCFVLLKSNASFDEVGSKIKSVLLNNASGDGKALKPEGILFPMEKWHLYDEFEYGDNTGGRIRFVWMLGTIGVFVLLLACI
ncbi:MAG TPA: ABC transporter permease, partial [Chryseolinea sp.]|nr:ABC transporter permease [Chryseolinea sp.]